MDPQATLTAIFEAINEKDWEQAIELSEALLNWMQRGGFPPQVAGPESPGQQWHREMARCICRLAMSMSQVSLADIQPS